MGPDTVGMSNGRESSISLSRYRKVHSYSSRSLFKYVGVQIFENCYIDGLYHKVSFQTLAFVLCVFLYSSLFMSLPSVQTQRTSLMLENWMTTEALFCIWFLSGCHCSGNCPKVISVTRSHTSRMSCNTMWSGGMAHWPFLDLSSCVLPLWDEDALNALALVF